jgi:hypothetical protein
MSYYFSIPAPQIVSFESLTKQLAQPDAKYVNAEVTDGKEINNTRLYVRDKSTRGVSLRYQDNAYSVGLNIIASETDFRLGIATAVALAELTNSAVLPEDEEGPMSPAAFTAKFNDEWIDSMKLLGVSKFREMIGKEQHILTINGCFINYNIGPKVYQHLDPTTDESLYRTLVDHIAKTQFFDFNKYAIPGHFVIKGEKTEKDKRILLFYPFGSQFLALSDVVDFSHGEENFELAYSELYKIATDKFTLVDELQYVVDPLTEEDYAQIIANVKAITFKKEKKSVMPLREDKPLSKDNPYIKFTLQDLDNEFYRLASIPNARTNIDALTKMTFLIEMYDQYSTDVPTRRNQAPAEVPKASSNPPAPKPSPNQGAIKPVKSSKASPTPAKKWWEFWK